MIYRIVEEATGLIVRSIDCPPSIAALYLQEAGSGHVLIEAGSTLQIPDEALVISDGVLTRRPGVQDIGGYADEGSEATIIQ